MFNSEAWAGLQDQAGTGPSTFQRGAGSDVCPPKLRAHAIIVGLPDLVGAHCLPNLGAHIVVHAKFGGVD